MNNNTECPKKNCYYPATNCNLGDFSDCPHIGSIEGNEAPPVGIQEGIRLPWTGLSMGHIDTAYVAGKNKPLVISTIGPENAGKTSLLAAWYLLIGKGTLDKINWSFAGSKTLEGWETLANGLRWVNSKIPPKFPPHTSSRSVRSPGLLHLSLSSPSNKQQNLLFTDAPGEWFSAWAQNVESETGIGAKWVASKADVYLILADSEALTGENKGNARNSLQHLINRVASVHNGKPVAFVWAKSDAPVNKNMIATISGLLKARLPDAKEFSITLQSDDAETVEADLFTLLSWVLSCSRTTPTLEAATMSSQDPLFLVGNR